jgi:hypothetical protein
MVNTMKAAIVYADILGFSLAATEPGARLALEQLSDIAHILSTDDSLAKYLHRPVWKTRFALSDSIFLVANDPVEACRAAAEFFFNLAFYNASQDVPVLMRGSIAFGEVRETGPIFPETGKGNLVGEAVVRAVQLERSGPKGPRLLVLPEVAELLRKSRSMKTLLANDGETAELLWLLPEDLSVAEGLLIGDVVGAACRLAASVSAASTAALHAAAYADLAVRSLLRLRRHNREAARIAIEKASLESFRGKLTRLYDRLREDPARRRDSLLRLLK